MKALVEHVTSRDQTWGGGGVAKKLLATPGNDECSQCTRQVGQGYLPVAMVSVQFSEELGLVDISYHVTGCARWMH